LYSDEPIITREALSGSVSATYDILRQSLDPTDVQIGIILTQLSNNLYELISLLSCHTNAVIPLVEI